MKPVVIFLIIAFALIISGILINGFAGGILLGVGATISILFIAAAFISKTI